MAGYSSTTIIRKNNTNPKWSDYVMSYLFPGILIIKMLYAYFLTLVASVLSFNLTPIFHPHTLRHLAFARFWLREGPFLSADIPAELSPLLSGPNSLIRGVVLDIGPGSGTQLGRYDFSAVTKMYGVEPARELHPELKRRADEVIEAADAGSGGARYQILDCGAETESLVPALAKQGLLGVSAAKTSSYAAVTASGAEKKKKKKKGGAANGSGNDNGNGTTHESVNENGNGNGEDNDNESGTGVFDTIISIRVLCGVPNQQDTIDGLYRLLKPGGTLIFYEHVIVPWRIDSVGSIIARLVQWAYSMLGWEWLMCGCCLDRDTKQALLDAGKGGGDQKRTTTKKKSGSGREKGNDKEESGWKHVEVTTLNPWSSVPHVVGYMTKK